MKISIASNQSVILSRWREILEEDYSILEASSIPEFMEYMKRTDIGLYLIHRSLADRNFFNNMSGGKWFVLADNPNDDEACTLLRLGAVGYGNTYMTPVRLREATKVVLSGKVWIGQQLMLKLIRRASSDSQQETHHAANTPRHNLSDRELEVAILISQGQSNLEIAAALDISERTVKAHISSIFKKTSTGSRLQLALLFKDERLHNQSQQPQ
jgi:DNA-binding NarL/FixJ family response regulator